MSPSTEPALEPEASEVAARLAAASALLAARGARLTDNRRHVLALILAARAPVSAYTLLDQLKERQQGAAPPTVYRALDFLMAQGLVHKIERLNAYLACVGEADHAHPEAVAFLICRVCGAVTELDAEAAGAALARSARARGFTPARATIEVEGICATCASAGAA